jgi:hypothetical protein
MTLGSGLAARMRSRLASRSMTGAQKGQCHTAGNTRSGGLTQLHSWMQSTHAFVSIQAAVLSAHHAAHLGSVHNISCCQYLRW